jgi:sugar transferase EpsL
MPRFIEVLLIVLLSPIWLPVLLVVALAVLLAIGQPILFRQIRIGRQGSQFTLIKFRTMIEAYGPDGDLLPDSARLTTFGRFFRASSLDELPELFNVLRGDMSLVGPRPLLPEYLNHYSSRHAQRHSVRPGITGLAQVRGRNTLTWYDRFELDVWYVEHRSILLDLRILGETLFHLVRRKGISAPGSVTMPKFTGYDLGE